jgi:signal transduction histidine kinase
MTTRRTWAIYGMLAAIWAVLMVWQIGEHARARHSFENMVVDRGRSISSTCGLLMRARSFFGVVSRERLESALKQLVDTNELRAVELLNTNGEVVASAGIPFEMPHHNEMDGGVVWLENTMIMENPVDLGTNVPQIVLPMEELRSLETNRAQSGVTNNFGGFTNYAEGRGPGGPPPFHGPGGHPEPGDTNGPPARPPGWHPEDGDTNRPPPRRRFDWRRGGRPYWMKEDEYRQLLEKKGAHTFVVVLSTEREQEATANDFWMRVVIAFLGTIAVAGYGLALRSLEKTSDLQLRLVRASELNLHLKELNLAAAGLAHETRNPLNIIRGLAHLISKQQNASPEIHAKSREIINETDRVTAQLNEFINYSRPREVRRAPVDLNAVAAEVARTLTYDIEEKSIDIQLQSEPLMIEADEQLLRQALFNLVLNAVQAVPAKGNIRIRASRRNNDEAFIEISDDGPGVPPENRAEIFKPYFTTHEEGTGLGLAVVQQIVLAHGWEITCVANEPAGALFRIAHIKLKNKD